MIPSHDLTMKLYIVQLYRGHLLLYAIYIVLSNDDLTMKLYIGMSCYDF